MAASSSSPLDPSSSNSSLGSFTYEVFLSFRGEDTRQNFMGHLSKALKDAGIHTFIDDEKMKAGENISETLLKAIKESRYCVVIMSKGYADSKWCLKELTAMFEHKKEIIPIFYHVEPSDVRHQSGPFEQSFKDHEKASNSAYVAYVEEWGKAMTKVGGIKGFAISKQSSKKEADWIQEIVKRVGGCSDNVVLPVAEHPVGIDSRVDEVMELLSTKEGGVKMVGIYGMGGVGKTTLAKAIHNRLHDTFDKNIYIEGIKDKKDRLHKVQEEFISKAFKEGTKKIYNTTEGSTEIKRRFHDKRVFVVLDDVDDGDQLEALAGGRDWFGEGTRILITTRDEHLLDPRRHVAKKYQVHELNSRESLCLFSRHAFNSDQPSEEFMEISKKIVKAAGGLPLALEVLGGSLSPETPEEVWEEVQTKLKNSKYSKIEKCLKISYDGLSLSEQEGFLDIACFFVGQKKDEAIDIWKGCDFGDPVSTVNSLLHKCLVKVDDSGRLRMHDLLRDMGTVIGSRSRLWDQKKVWEVLEEHKGTYEIKGIICEGYLEEGGKSSDSEGYSEGEGEGENFDALCSVVPPEQERASVDVEAFANMSNLQLLLLEDINLKGDFSRMPRSLRSLKWTGCSMQMLPENFNIQKLGCLMLHSNDIVQLWSDSCISKEKVFANLKVLDLSYCVALTKLPDFSRSLDLEKLYLRHCYNLTGIPESIGKFTRLKRLDLFGCRSLSALPSSIRRLTLLEELELSDCTFLSTTLLDFIGNLTELRRFNLYYCKSLSALPYSIGRLTLLEKLRLLKCTSLSTLPDSIGNLTKLRRLDLSLCESLLAFPYSIERLTLLEKLSLRGCKSLSALPDFIGNLTGLRRLNLSSCVTLSSWLDSIGNLTLLKELDLSYCTSLSTLPDSIGNLTGLRRLDLSDCESLSALPDSIGNLTLLEELKLNNCKSLSTLPDSIGNLTKLRELNMCVCESLSALPDSVGNLTKIEELQLGFCKSLTSLPDSIGNLIGLRRLYLSGCKHLSALPDSVGNLSKVEELKLFNCTSLPSLSDSIGNLTRLRLFDVFECTSLSALPYSIGRLTLLETLNLKSCTSLSTLPDSIGQLTRLSTLYVFNCRSLSILPDSIGQLTRLRTLDAFNCRSLSMLPDSIKNLTQLKSLDLSHTSLEALPDCIGNLTGLKELCLASCTSLSTLPSSIVNIRRLSALVLSESGIEELSDSVPLLESLKWLVIARCRLRSHLPLSEMKCLKGLVIGGEDIGKDENDSDDGDAMEVCESSDGIAHVGGEVNQKDESDMDGEDEFSDSMSDNDDGDAMDESDSDDEDQNNGVCEIPYGITHYSRHTQECRRIRYIESSKYIFDDLIGTVFELSIWAVSGRERKIILLVYPSTEWSQKRHEIREYWNGPWLKHIFPDDFTPLHDTEALDAYASTSPAPDISDEQLEDFYYRMETLTWEKLRCCRHC